MELEGQTALVTGASRGIGRAIAIRLANAGARVIAHYGGSKDEAEALVAQIRASGGRADTLQADLAQPDAAQKLIEGLETLGIAKLDILISNAGLGGVRPIEQQTVETFDQFFAVNVRTPYFLIQQALPLLSDGARIVILSSTTARSAPVGASVYASTKGALNVMVRTLAAELGPRGIRLNGLAPGAIDTDMGSFLRLEGPRQATLAEQAFKRVGQPEDVADAALFLVSQAGRWVTGQIIEASGGARL